MVDTYNVLSTEFSSHSVSFSFLDAEDMKYDETGYANSFVLSNISPTTSTFEGELDRKSNNIVYSPYSMDYIDTIYTLLLWTTIIDIVSW